MILNRFLSEMGGSLMFNELVLKLQSGEEIIAFFDNVLNSEYILVTAIELPCKIVLHREWIKFEPKEGKYFGEVPAILSNWILNQMSEAGVHPTRTRLN